MSLGLAFWVLMICWLVFSAWSYWPGAPGGPGPAWGGTILAFVLYLLLGWAVFGAPIRG